MTFLCDPCGTAAGDTDSDFAVAGGWTNNTYSTPAPTTVPVGAAADDSNDLYSPSMSSHGGSGGGGHSSAQMDVLAAVFFAVAGTWLLVAMLYSGMVLLFLRMRAAGELDNIYDEHFGRVYLCGSRRFYLPLGCVFRRYLRHLQHHQDNSLAPPAPLRHMTTRERRDALEVLLGDFTIRAGDRGPPSTTTTTTAAAVMDDEPNVVNTGVEIVAECIDNVETEASSSQRSENDDDDELPVCSICLADYAHENELVTRVPQCGHEFHHCCLLDWLQRPSNSDAPCCPCCRAGIVSEDAIWQEILQQRSTRKAKERQTRRKSRFLKNQTSPGPGDEVVRPDPTDRTDDYSSHHEDDHDVVSLEAGLARPSSTGSQ